MVTLKTMHVLKRRNGISKIVPQKSLEKIVKLCLHSSYKVQNSIQFDEIFYRKFQTSILTFFDVLDAL